MGRAPCCSKVGLNRGPWSIEEDRLLTHYIQAHGEGHWRALPSKAGLSRCGKSCRLRWVNYLRPGIKRGNFTSDENEAIIRLHSRHGNRWSLIAAEFPGRTDNEIKNHWNTHLRKRALLLAQNAENTVANDHDQPSSEAAGPKSNNTDNNTKDELDSALQPTVESSATKVTSLSETYSNEEDEKQNMSSDDHHWAPDDQNSQLILTESTKVKHATPTSSSATSFSSTIFNTDDHRGEVDAFFFDLDDLLDVDKEMDGHDSVSGDDGNEQLIGRLYMEYLQVLNPGNG